MNEKTIALKRIVNKVDYNLLILIILPLVILSVNKTWIFTPINTVDPWIYFGHFIRFDQYLKAFSDTYYTTRLPWIIPGHLIYEWFPPLVANYVLHLLFFNIATVSLYLTLKYTISQRAALFTSVLMGCHSYF